MHDNPAMAWLGIAALFVAAVAAAMLLRACRAPGWSILGGICAGLLLGSTLLGRLAPVLYEKMYQGGAAQHAQLYALQQYQNLALADPAREPVDAESIALAQRELLSAQHGFQAPLRFTAICITTLVMIGAAAGVRGDPDPHQHWFHALSIGAFAALLPGGAAFLLFHFAYGLPITPALLGSSAVAIGPWIMSPSDRRSADFAELGGARLMHRAAVVASCLAVIVAGFAFWRTAGAAELIYIIPLAALIAGSIAPRARAAWLPPLLQFLLVPSLAALAAVKIDLYDDFSFWLVLLILLFSGDGRWFGAYIGALLPSGRKSLRTMRLVMGSMACGPTQLAVAALAAQAALLETKYIMPLILGAALIEVVAPLRRRMTERLLQTEIEIDEIMKDS